MKIIGINAHHPDASVALIQDGEVIWAAEEERFSRIKHDCSFPKLALAECIKANGITSENLDYVAITGNKKSNLYRKVAYGLSRAEGAAFLVNRLGAKFRRNDQDETTESILESAGLRIKKDMIYRIEHHLCHISSALFCSPYHRSAFASVDGLGDFVSTMTGFADGKNLEIYRRTYFPHSLGFFYTAATQYLGFENYGEEYKVMGLASYGEPVYTDLISQIILLGSGGSFKLNRKYFCYQTGNQNLLWKKGIPHVDRLYSDAWVKLLGNVRNKSDEINQHDMNVAASVQEVMEMTYFHILNGLHERSKSENLCLAGGVAYNCVANGKITDHTPFKNIYIQPAAGDAGTALGAALYLYRQKSVKPVSVVMDSALKGPVYSDEQIQDILHPAKGIAWEKMDENDLLESTAELVAEGAVIGWFQNRMEFGPRALGARSIIADSRRGDIKDLLNRKVKFREKFRPFAPMVKEEKADEYFEMKCPASPFMLNVYPVRENFRPILKGITHVDGSARVQTVSKKTYPKLWNLLDFMEQKTGVAVLLNTSFNENEPIVNTPQEAIDCFLRTQMDRLVIGSFMVRRQTNSACESC